MNLRRTTAPFTAPLEPKDFVVLRQLIPEVSAFYDVSVRQLTALPLASFRHSLTGLPLLLASSFVARIVELIIWTLVLLQGTCTPLIHDHARRTQFWCSGLTEATCSVEKISATAAQSRSTASFRFGAAI